MHERAVTRQVLAHRLFEASDLLNTLKIPGIKDPHLDKNEIAKFPPKILDDPHNRMQAQAIESVDHQPRFNGITQRQYAERYKITLATARFRLERMADEDTLEVGWAYLDSHWARVYRPR